jgi:hypothetical protein
MTLTIKIQMDNAAFENYSGTEAARILRKLAARIDGEDCTPGDLTPCIDINGNKVGKAEVTP